MISVREAAWDLIQSYLSIKKRSSVVWVQLVTCRAFMSLSKDANCRRSPLIVLLLLLRKTSQGCDCAECLRKRDRLWQGHFWLIWVNFRAAGVGLSYLLKKVIIVRRILSESAGQQPT